MQKRNFLRYLPLQRWIMIKMAMKILLLCGNINHARLRFGKYDANYGVLFKGDGKGNFKYINQQQSGFHLRGDVRSVITINNKLLFGINQQEIECYRLR